MYIKIDKRMEFKFVYIHAYRPCSQSGSQPHTYTYTIHTIEQFKFRTANNTTQQNKQLMTQLLQWTHITLVSADKKLFYVAVFIHTRTYGWFFVMWPVSVLFLVGAAQAIHAGRLLFIVQICI